MILQRIWKTAGDGLILGATYGVFIDDHPFAVCIEPENPVPAGTYTYKPYNSPKFHRWVWMTQDVPGHTFIEIHTGNGPEDTEDCQVIGSAFGWYEKLPGQLLYGIRGGTSIQGFTDLMLRTAKLTELVLEIRDIPDIPI